MRPSQPERDLEIWKDYLIYTKKYKELSKEINQYTVKALARKYELTPGRLWQIISQFKRKK